MGQNWLCAGFRCGKVEVHPETANATIGEQVRIICTTESERAVEWEFVNSLNRRMAMCIRSREHYDLGDKHECVNEKHSHTLIINNVGLNDSGTYTCIEDNGYGASSDSSRLYVHRK